jgi:hypothetical protein
MPLPQGLRDFEVANATVQVWLYKKSTIPDRGIRFTGRWIDTDVNLDQALKQAIGRRRQISRRFSAPLIRLSRSLAQTSFTCDAPALSAKKVTIATLASRPGCASDTQNAGST